jgi:hypothetical protein
VTLAVELEATSGVFEATPPLADVPVLWPGAWASGDPCLVVFCEESFAKWWDTGSVEPPEVLRRHGMHAVCIPIVARAGQAVQLVALAPLVTAALDALKTGFSAWATAMNAEPPSTPVTNGTMVSLVIPRLLTALTAWPPPVAAQKVMAR